MDIAEPFAEGEDVVKYAQRVFEADLNHWNPIYEKAREDLRFQSDEKFAQWPEEDYNARIGAQRPALTVDQLSQFVHQVVNDIRMNTPSIKVIPDGNEASVEAAEVYSGLIKNIEYKSNADDVYDTAALFSVKSSIGFIRVDHDYCYEDGFEQELKLKRVINPLACFPDSESIECDGRDQNHATILEKMTVAVFKKRWPKAEVSSFSDKEKRDYTKLKDDDEITVAEFFRMVTDEKTIKLNDDGSIEEYAEGDEGYKSTRKIKKTKIMRYWLSGTEVLEETRFPGKYIPLVPVYGEEAWQDGERHLFSLIRKSKSAQQMYNLWKSLETELLMKQPIAPIMAAEGQIDDYKKDWLNPSKAMALRYKPMSVDGQAVPAPARLAPPTIPTGFVNAARETIDDIKASMGLYNASIGQKSNETSGVAINQRKQEGDVATFHFGDNLNRSICQVGRIIVFAAPEIYDTQRIIQIMGEEDEPKEVGINGAMAQEQKETVDLTTGKYTVRVITGAPFTTRRQEAAEFFTEIVKQQPELMQVMGDLLFKNMDIPGAQAMASRMKKLIDPKLLDPSERDEEAPPPPDPEKQQMAQIIEEGKKMIADMQQQMQEMQVKLASKEGEVEVKHQQLEFDEAKAMGEYELKHRELDIKEQQVSGELALAAQGQKIDMLLEVMSQIQQKLAADAQTEEIGNQANSPAM